MTVLCASVLASTGLLAAATADACTRFIYLAADDQVLTERSIESSVDIGTNL